MRRIRSLLCVAGLTVGALAVGTGSAIAQTANTHEFCHARLRANDAEGTAANVAVMNKAIKIAPPAVLPAITKLRDAYKEAGGDKLFNTPLGLALLSQVDSWVYDNCGAQVSVTASNYQFAGIPATLPSGITTFKMKNIADDLHVIVISKMKPAAQGHDLSGLLAVPTKQRNKYFEDRGQSFAGAGPGAVGYAPIKLTKGTYAYGDPLPEGGRQNGTPYFMLGMKGTFKVR